jgi:hypothetical protein
MSGETLQVQIFGTRLRGIENNTRKDEPKKLLKKRGTEERITLNS